MTALIVCMRFSASSKTTDCGPANTSSVTSISVMPNLSAISLPIVVFVSWNDGRQCMNMASGFAMAIFSAFT